MPSKQTKSEETSTVEIHNVSGMPLALFFTPGAIRDHFEHTEYADKIEAMTDDELAQFGFDALICDTIYDAFDRALRGSIFPDDE